MNFKKEITGQILAVILLSTGVVACQKTVDDTVASSIGYATREVTPEMMTDAEGTLWNLVSYNETPVLPGSEITLEFVDGRLNGFAGCNQYFADYQLENGQLIVKAVGSTRRACGEPPGVMEQENTYLGLIQQADNAIAVTENTLTIKTSEGNLVFEAVR